VAKLFTATSQAYTRSPLAGVPLQGQGNPEHQAGPQTKTENVVEVDRLSVEFRGTVKTLGQDITTMTVKQLRPVRAKFGFVFQDPASSPNPRLHVGDCVARPLKVHKAMCGAECTARVAELLDAVRVPNDTAARTWRGRWR
jgi:ABC-type microcin C transport system duplicated ATPase subunit YejF